MPSRLRHQSQFAPVSAHTTQSSYPHTLPAPQPPQKKQRMSITQTYRLARSARGKLSGEASRGDHDLRLLVGHANLLDTLMLELQDAENEQEHWFNETMRSSSSEPKHVQWTDQFASSNDEDSDADSEDGFDDMTIQQLPRRRSTSPPPPPSVSVRSVADEDEDEDDDSDSEYDTESDVDEDDESDNLDLALVRTVSRRPDFHHHISARPKDEDEPSSPPELVHDCTSDESDDDSASTPPASPPQPRLNAFDTKAHHDHHEAALLEEASDYMLPAAQSQPLLVSAY